MTEFLQEYGKIIVAVLVVLALVSVVVLFREPIQNMFAGLFSSFFQKIETESGFTLPGFQAGGKK